MSKKISEPHFIERPLPTEEEIRSFNRQIKNQERGDDINGRLSEIYRDERGQLVDVKKLEKKARRQAVVMIFRWLVGLSFVGLAIWAALLVFSPTQKNDVEIKINAPETVMAGQEFDYQISLKNNSNSVIKSVKLELVFPDNFVFSSSELAPTSGNNYWTLSDLPSGTGKSFSVRGKIINQESSANTIYGKLFYRQADFSSDLKKEASASTQVSAIGFRTEVDYPSAALAGAENNLSLKISNFENLAIENFRIDFEVPASATIIDPENITASSSWTIKKNDNHWEVSGVNASSSEIFLPFRFKIKNSDQSRAEIIVRFSVQDSDGDLLTFFEKRAGIDIIKNDLNLTMIVNGSQGDRAVNFGETLNYTISYSNRGANSLKNIAVSVVIDSSLVDWGTLNAESNGKLKNSIITWTKDEVPALAEIKPGQEGDLSFSVKLKKFSSSDLGTNFSIKSYAQFNVDSNTSNSEFNRSNVINSSLNSDLNFSEKILYFNEDNLPVGEGPLPPKVGEKTSLRVYWRLDNTLHELDKTKVFLPLPPNTSFEGRVKVQAGSIYYDQATNQIVWDLGRIPLSVAKVEGEFNLSLIPTINDKNKILIISPGSTVTAIDLENNAEIKLSAAPKTSKLEDDDIASLSNSGKVQ